MTIEELLQAFRIDAEDTVAPYLVSDDRAIEYLNEAESEAALRMRLLHESADAAVCEIDVAAGTSVYALHASLFELTHTAFRLDGATERTPVTLVSTDWLDQKLPC